VPHFFSWEIEVLVASCIINDRVLFDLDSPLPYAWLWVVGNKYSRGKAYNHPFERWSYEKAKTSLKCDMWSLGQCGDVITGSVLKRGYPCSVIEIGWYLLRTLKVGDGICYPTTLDGRECMCTYLYKHI